MKEKETKIIKEEKPLELVVFNPPSKEKAKQMIEDLSKYLQSVYYS